MSETFEMQPETGGKYEPLGAGELLDHDDNSLRLRAGSTTVEVAALAPTYSASACSPPETRQRTTLRP